MVEPFDVQHTDFDCSRHFVSVSFQQLINLLFIDRALFTPQSQQVNVSWPVQKLNLSCNSCLAEAIIQLEDCLGRTLLNHLSEM